MKLKREPLLAALRLAKHSLVSYDFIPIQAHFIFEDDVLYTYNDFSTTVVGYKTGLKCALRGDVLLPLLEVSAADEVEIKGDTTEVMKATFGSRDFDLPALPLSDSTFDMPSEKMQISIPFTKEVLEALKLCLITVGQDALRPEFMGVTLGVSSDKASFYSSDNATVGRRVIKLLKGAGAKNLSVVIPKAACQQAIDIYGAVITDPEKQPGRLVVSEKYAIFEFESKPKVQVISRLLEVETADFEQLLAQHMKGAERFKIPASLPQSIKSAEVLLQKDVDQRCEISNTARLLRVKVAGALGKMADEISVKEAGEPRAVIVNPAHVSRVLPHCTEMCITPAGSLLLSGEGYINLIESNGVAQT